MWHRLFIGCIQTGRYDISLVHPANEDGLERIARWIEKGVKIHTVETDLTALYSFYRGALGRLKP